MMRSNKGQGYVALDYVEFRYLEACVFTPPNAKPVLTTMQPTTVEPTEPPDCKLYILQTVGTNTSISI